jgi:1,2-phenylacetyl-CoA epoxidase PaaB subunit
LKQKDVAVDEEYKKLLSTYMKGDYKTTFIKNKKQEAELKSALKSKALSKAMQNVRRSEAIKIEKIKKSELKSEPKSEIKESTQETSTKPAQ